MLTVVSRMRSCPLIRLQMKMDALNVEDLMHHNNGRLWRHMINHVTEPEMALIDDCTQHLQVAIVLSFCTKLI